MRSDFLQVGSFSTKNAKVSRRHLPVYTIQKPLCKPPSGILLKQKLFQRMSLINRHLVNKKFQLELFYLSKTKDQRTQFARNLVTSAERWMPIYVLFTPAIRSKTKSKKQNGNLLWSINSALFTTSSVICAMQIMSASRVDTYTSV